jgi:predicted patatin/cPLA2 family phospholipase
MPGLDIHAGILLALADHGINKWDLISGTSAGSIIGALLANGRSPDNIAAVLRGLQDDDVRHERFLWKLRLFGIRYFMDNDRIEKLLKDLLPPAFSMLQIPFQAHATRELDGTEECFSLTGQLVPAVLASAAIAGVFPPIMINFLPYSDGGTTNYCAIPEYAQTYADTEYWLLIARPPYNYLAKDETVLSRLLLNVHLMIEDQIDDTVARMKVAFGDRVRVIRPSCGADAGTLHFDHSLIQQAYLETKQILSDLARAETPSRPEGPING